LNVTSIGHFGHPYLEAYFLEGWWGWHVIPLASGCSTDGCWGPSAGRQGVGAGTTIPSVWIVYVFTTLYASLSFLLLFLTIRILDFNHEYFCLSSVHMRMHLPVSSQGGTRSGKIGRE